MLRSILVQEIDLSRRLTIAGALWKTVRDPVFIDCLEAARQSQDALLAGAHLLQVLWLER